MLKRLAVLDIGSNSTKLLVADVLGGRLERKVVDRSQVVGLAEGLTQAGTLNPEAMERTCLAVKSMADEARGLGAEVRCVATQALRIAANRDAFLELIRCRAGVDCAVVSGEEEASLSFEATAARLADRLEANEDLVVFDAGGGSTELIYGRDGAMRAKMSAPLGALVLMDRFLGLADPPTDAQWEGAVGLAHELLRETATESRFALPERFTLAGVGGTATTLGSVMLGLERFDSERIHGSLLTRGELDRQIVLYRSLRAEDRKKIKGMPPDRARISIAGAAVVSSVLDWCGKKSFTISESGLRYGMLARFAREVGEKA